MWLHIALCAPVVLIWSTQVQAAQFQESGFRNRQDNTMAKYTFTAVLILLIRLIKEEDECCYKAEWAN